MEIKSSSILERVDCDKDHEHAKTAKDAKRLKRAAKCPTTWWYRVRYIDPETGKLKDLQRRARSKADAGDQRELLKKKIEATAGRIVGSENMTFAELCRYYEKHYVKEAEYVNDDKIEGLRSWYTVKLQLDMLESHFGARRISAITYGHIRSFRSLRFRTKTKAGTQRTVATVNRELSLLRRVLNVAIAEGWLTTKNPFKQGEPLISLAKETKRQRIITAAEEKALLEACNAPKRGHLRAIIVAAIDTGCRRSELLKLCWRNVDLESGVINIIKFNTKTAKERSVVMTDRLQTELQRLRAEAPDDPNVRVFGDYQTVKRSFAGARADAGLPDLRFHDLRHTTGSRLAPHMAIAEVGRVLGHEQPQTTYRYINVNTETITRAATALNAFNSQSLEAQVDSVAELVN